MSARASDPAFQALRQTGAEPWRVKMVESVRLPTRAERERALEEAHYSPVFLRSEDVYVDLITDSGTAAMSDVQWSALMRGDEAYMGSRSYEHFERAVREATGFEHVVPTHQGRAAEHIVMQLLVGKDQLVLCNTHFDTTRAHVHERGATPVDLMLDRIWDFREAHPFKGDFDLRKLERAFARHRGRVAMVVATVLNNFACSSPVSLENLRAVRRMADRYGVPLFLDAARFAENAWFIQQRETGQGERAIGDIAREVFALADGCWVSAKKDAMVNIGGFIAVRDAALADRCRERLVLYEGFPTYGGLARRDLEAMAVGLREATDQAVLDQRMAQLEHLGHEMQRAGAVVSLPIGGSGVFVDVAALYPHLPPEALPGIALCADFYREGGIRVGAAPFPVTTVSAETGELVERQFEFARFAVPRRALTRAHLDYVAAITRRVVEVAPHNRGFRVVQKPEVMGHFFARFAPL